jgi:hypothetical protein
MKTEDVKILANLIEEKLEERLGKAATGTSWRWEYAKPTANQSGVIARAQLVFEVDGKVVGGVRGFDIRNSTNGGEPWIAMPNNPYKDKKGDPQRFIFGALKPTMRENIITRILELVEADELPREFETELLYR